MQIAAVLTTALLVGWLTRRYVPVAAKPVYLIDTYTYKPPDRYIRFCIDSGSSSQRFLSSHQQQQKHSEVKALISQSICCNAQFQKSYHQC